MSIVAFSMPKLYTITIDTPTFSDGCYVNWEVLPDTFYVIVVPKLVIALEGVALLSPFYLYRLLINHR
jgi:hypothetical protein